MEIQSSVIKLIRLALQLSNYGQFGNGLSQLLLFCMYRVIIYGHLSDAGNFTVSKCLVVSLWSVHVNQKTIMMNELDCLVSCFMVFA